MTETKQNGFWQNYVPPQFVFEGKREAPQELVLFVCAVLRSSPQSICLTWFASSLQACNSM